MYVYVFTHKIFKRACESNNDAMDYLFARSHAVCVSFIINLLAENEKKKPEAGYIVNKKFRVD